MRFTIRALSLFSLLFSLTSFAADPPSVRDRIYDFLDKNVMKRTQVVSTEGTLEQDKVQYDVKFSATISWSKLEKTEEGLTFVETRDIKQSSTQVVKPGEKAEVFQTDRVVELKYAVSLKELTQSLVGVANVTKNTLEDPTGTAFVTMMELSPDNKELYIYQSLAGFTETSLDGRTLQPVSTASSSTMYFDASGKLHTDETLKFYKVDINNDFVKEEIHRFNLHAAEVK